MLEIIGKITHGTNNMNYKEEITNTKNKLKSVIKKLKVGDIVYEEQPRWIDYDYHPQIIEKIDLKNCKLFVYEKSINVRKWVETFNLYNETNKKFEYYY